MTEGELNLTEEVVMLKPEDDESKDENEEEEKRQAAMLKEEEAKKQEQLKLEEEKKVTQPQLIQLLMMSPKTQGISPLWKEKRRETLDIVTELLGARGDI